MNIEQENEIMAMKGDERSSEKSSLLPESQSEKPEVENDDVKIRKYDVTYNGVIQLGNS